MPTLSSITCIAAFALAILHFQPAPNRVIAPTSGDVTITTERVVPFSPTEVYRRCLPAEKAVCKTECAGQGGIATPSRPWIPPVDTSGVSTPYFSVKSCDVHTVGGVLTTVCQCLDPGLRT
jgi:hypothetical protein